MIVKTVTHKYSSELTLHSGNVRALDVVFEFGNLLLEFVQRDLLVLCGERSRSDTEDVFIVLQR